jgi:hypothetical protein
LKYCKLSWIGSVETGFLLFATTELSPIEYLLSYVPQLRRLSSLCVAKSIDRKIESSSTISNHLTYVSFELVRLNSITFEVFESIIRNIFGQVQVLHISIKYELSYLNSDRWKRLLLSYMPHLRILDLIIFRTSCPDKEIRGLVDRIDQFNSSFWFERKWFFEYYINNNEYIQYFIFSSTNLYK